MVGVESQLHLLVGQLEPPSHDVAGELAALSSPPRRRQAKGILD
jgi:hypothetical protein